MERLDNLNRSGVTQVPHESGNHASTHVANILGGEQSDHINAISRAIPTLNSDIKELLQKFVNQNFSDEDFVNRFISTVNMYRKVIQGVAEKFPEIDAERLQQELRTFKNLIHVESMSEKILILFDIVPNQQIGATEDVYAGTDIEIDAKNLIPADTILELGTRDGALSIDDESTFTSLTEIAKTFFRTFFTANAGNQRQIQTRIDDLFGHYTKKWDIPKKRFILTIEQNKLYKKYTDELHITHLTREANIENLKQIGYGTVTLSYMEGGEISEVKIAIDGWTIEILFAKEISTRKFLGVKKEKAKIKAKDAHTDDQSAPNKGGAQESDDNEFLVTGGNNNPEDLAGEEID